MIAGSLIVAIKVEAEGVKLALWERWIWYPPKAFPEEPSHWLQRRSAPFACSVAGLYRTTPSLL